MADAMTMTVLAANSKLAPTTVVFVTESLKAPESIVALKNADGVIKRFAALEKFKGKAQSVLTITGVADWPVDRLVVIGLGAEEALIKPDSAKTDWVMLGGLAAGQMKSGSVSVIGQCGEQALTASQIADLSLGMRMRNYSFDKYKTKKKEDETPQAIAISFLTADATAVKREMKSREAMAQ
eukprot:gene5033-6677_t